MKVVVCGEANSQNIGDPIIVDSCSYLLKKVNPHVDISVLDISYRSPINFNNKSVNSSQHSYLKLIRRLINKSMKKLSVINKANNLIKWILIERSNAYNTYTNTLKDASVLVIAGGQLLMDNDLYYPLRINALVKTAQKYNVEVIFNSLGVEESRKTSYGYWLFKQALTSQCVKKISTRDNLDFLNSYLIGNGIKAKITPDAAIYSADTYGVNKFKESNVVGLGLISPSAYKNVYKRTRDKQYYIDESELKSFWVDLIKFLNSNGIEWKIFVNGSEPDYEFAKEVALNFVGKEEINNVILDRPSSSYQLIKQVSQFRLILSHRLHSHIIAYSLGIPSVGFLWDKKVLAFGVMSKREKFYFNIKDYDKRSNIYSTIIDLYNSPSIDQKIYEDLRESVFENLSFNEGG